MIDACNEDAAELCPGFGVSKSMSQNRLVTTSFNTPIAGGGRKRLAHPAPLLACWLPDH
jgi:hypothetical protein